MAVVNTALQRLLVGGCAVLVVACHRPATRPDYAPRRYPACVRVLPVGLYVEPKELATAATPRDLTLPESLIKPVVRAGIDNVRYSASVCGGARPLVDSVQQSTGFPDLDHFLDAHVADLGLALPDSGCTTVALVLVKFFNACEPPQTAD